MVKPPHPCLNIGYGEVADVMRDMINEGGAKTYSCNIADKNDVKQFLTEKRDRAKKIFDEKFKELDNLKQNRKL